MSRSDTRPMDVETIREALKSKVKINWRSAAEFLLGKLDDAEREIKEMQRRALDEVTDGCWEEDD